MSTLFRAGLGVPDRAQLVPRTLHLVWLLQPVSSCSASGSPVPALSALVAFIQVMEGWNLGKYFVRHPAQAAPKVCADLGHEKQTLRAFKQFCRLALTH